MARDQLHQMITTSPNRDILTEIFEKTRLKPEMAKERSLLKGERCLLTKDPEILDLMTPDFFFVAPGVLLDMFLNFSFMLPKFFKRIWINSNVKDYNLVLYYSLRKKRNKERFSRT